MIVVIFLLFYCLIILLLPIADESQQLKWDRDFQISYIISLFMEWQMIKTIKIGQERVKHTN
jgi:hypothetical protein